MPTPTYQVVDGSNEDTASDDDEQEEDGHEDGVCREDESAEGVLREPRAAHAQDGHEDEKNACSHTARAGGRTMKTNAQRHEARTRTHARSHNNRVKEATGRHERRRKPQRWTRVCGCRRSDRDTPRVLRAALCPRCVPRRR